MNQNRLAMVVYALLAQQDKQVIDNALLDVGVKPLEEGEYMDSMFVLQNEISLGTKSGRNLMITVEGG